MTNQLYISLSVIVLTFAMAEAPNGDFITQMNQEEQDALYVVLSDDVLRQENNKICDGKDQSSPENLIKTMAACGSVGRFVDSMAFVFLLTDKFDHLIKPSYSDFLQNSKVIREMSRDYALLQDESFKVNLQLFQLEKGLKNKEVLGQLVTSDEQKLLSQLTQKKAELYEKVILPPSYEPIENIAVKVGRFKIVDTKVSPFTREIKMGMVEVSSLPLNESSDMVVAEVDGLFYGMIPIIPPTIKQTKPVIDKAFIQENNKLCDGKDQSSVEALLRSWVACQNVGRNSELLPLIYLGTNDDKYLFDGTENGINDDLVVEFTFGVGGMTNKTKLSDWRENAKSVLKAKDEAYDAKTAKMMKFTYIAHFVAIKDQRVETSTKNIKSGIVGYKAIIFTEENAEEISNDIHIMQVNDQYYLFNLPL